MIGGGVPKNFAQDIVVAAEILGEDVPMHKYAVQVTVADVRDGALSGSTLKEATVGARWIPSTSRWSIARPRWPCRSIVGYAYHKGAWKNRRGAALEPGSGSVAVK